MKISSKYLNIQQLESLRSVLDKSGNLPEQYQMCFMTAFGIVVGDLVNHNLDFDPKEQSLSDLITIAVEKSINLISLVPQMKQYTLTQSAEYDLKGDGALMLLENVSIYKNNFRECILSSNTFYLHADSVIGFSLIPRNFEFED